ncbi:MAG: hypothetical protein AMXMBFR7_18000 [Planctomycetota bacterium]
MVTAELQRRPVAGTPSVALDQANRRCHSELTDALKRLSREPFDRACSVLDRAERIAVVGGHADGIPIPGARVAREFHQVESTLRAIGRDGACLALNAPGHEALALYGAEWANDLDLPLVVVTARVGGELIDLADVAIVVAAAPATANAAFSIALATLAAMLSERPASARKAMG